jgi:cob(I)alamin adenosyltransferase
MVNLTRIYTRGGDKGETSLGDGSRVGKDAPLVEAYGAVDEANAVIGVVRLHTAENAATDAMLARVQNDLFDLGADLCTPWAESEAPDQSQIDRLEREIDAMNASLAPLKSFVLPGGTPAAAQLHVARTTLRRAERAITAAGRLVTINPLALNYANRLSDHLFVLSRHLNAQASGDVLWVPGGSR